MPISLDWGIELSFTYRLSLAGDIRVAVQGTPVGNGPKTLPRIGVQLMLDKEHQNVQWLGLGPHETYPDSCQSGFSIGGKEPFQRCTRRMCGRKKMATA